MLVFFFLEKIGNHGGVQTLILNISQYLSDNNIKFVIVDSKDGYIYNEAINRDLKFEFIDFDEPNLSLISENDVLVSFGHFERELSFFASIKIKVLFWSVFPDEIINIFKIRNSLRNITFSNSNLLSRKFTNKLVDLLINKNAIVVMDDSHIAAMEVYGYSSDKLNNIKIIPIPIKIAPKRRFLLKKSSKVTISYIGRAEDWKILPFIKLYRDLDLLNIDIVIYLFSNNSYKFIELLKDNLPLSNKIIIKTYDGLIIDGILDVIRDKVQIAFSMGTAILETSKIGIPTVLLDPLYKLDEIEGLYRWFHDEKGYCLGLPTWLMQNELGVSIKNLLSVLEDSDLYYGLVNKTYNYTVVNHSISNVANRLIVNANRSLLYNKDLKFIMSFMRIRKYIYNILKKDN